MARTSLLNCLSCRNPYQAPHSLNCLIPFHWKTLFFTEKYFVASPSQRSACSYMASHYAGMRWHWPYRNKHTQICTLSLRLTSLWPYSNMAVQIRVGLESRKIKGPGNLSPPPLMAPKHCKTNNLGAMIVFWRGIFWTPLTSWTSSCGSFIVCPGVSPKLFSFFSFQRTWGRVNMTLSLPELTQLADTMSLRLRPSGIAISGDADCLADCVAMPAL